MNRVPSIVLGLVLLLVSCRPIDVVLLEPPDVPPPSIDGLRALRIEPGEVPLLVDRGSMERASVALGAMGTFDDGERDVTELVDWRLGRTELGSVVKGLVTTAGVGGETFVEARSGAIVATVALTVRVEIVVDRTAAQTSVLIPVGVEDDLTEGIAPELVYPSNGVVVPANVKSLTPQWTHDQSHDLFELRIESDTASIRVFVDDDRLRLADELAWILQSQVGRTFAMYVRATNAATQDRVYRSNAVSVQMTRSSIDGTGYYAQMHPPAIMRMQLDNERPEQRYPTFAETTRCTGCHALSRDGRRLAVSRGEERLALFDVDEDRLRDDLAERHFESGAFNPGATRLVYVDEGRLRLMDVDADRSAGDITLPPSTHGTHPDWSPDGRFIVFTYSTGEKPEEYEFEETDIARVDSDGQGGFSAPEILVPSGGDSLGYPSISWDGRYVAYVRVQGDHGRAPEATIEIVPSDGSAQPVALTRLNEIVGTESRTAIRNIVPTWLPTSSADERWIAFSSHRAYGHILPQGARAQLWISAFDPNIADAGGDASSPAFWATFQSRSSSNYRLHMSLATFDGCRSIVEVCNQLDDDCDLDVDESCCQPEASETCGNLIDDDCNGIVDDTCACDGPEICGNGLDDNCDREIDEECP